MPATVSPTQSPHARMKPVALEPGRVTYRSCREAMAPTEFLGLMLAAAAGGAINAVAGGGTLVTFPTLLFFGTPPIVANATSTVALVIATLLFLAQGTFRRFADFNGPRHQRLRGAILFQMAVAVYGGYFGAGIGILMLASLGFIGVSDIHETNTLKTILASLINVVAAVWFIYEGLIHWPKAGVRTAGALLGYYLGSHYAQRIPQRRVRQIITLIAFIISAVTFYEEFVR